MYGKWFTSVYEGSMIGAGATVFAVWGYCCGKAEPEDHTVSLNPILLSTIIGEPIQEIEKAIKHLCSPDPKSRCTEHEGRRLLHQGGLDYFVVTHAEYRNIKNSDDIRAYHREMKRHQRDKKNDVQDIPGHSMNPVYVYASASDKRKRKYFVPPTTQEVEEYGKKIEYEISGDQFVNAYEQKGWMVGKSKMKDWKAAVRNWKANGWGKVKTIQANESALTMYELCEKVTALKRQREFLDKESHKQERRELWQKIQVLEEQKRRFKE